MRKTYILMLLTGIFILVQAGCTTNFEEMNTDSNNTPNALPRQLLAPALINTLKYNMIRNRNLNNELMQVTVNISDAEGLVFRYDIRDNLGPYLWDGWFSQLTNFKDIYRLSSTDPNYNKSYMGISLICQSWIYSLLTDTFGDVPYFDSNKARTDKVYEPAFDKQKDIYLDIFSKLEEANTLLAANTAITAGSDPVFSGNISRWRKFGNSLYLRLLLRLSGKAEVAGDCIAKIKQIVNTDAPAYPVMAGNDDSAILRWTGIAPYISPYYTIRAADFRAPAICSFFIDNLVRWQDPRINITYGTGGVNRWGIAPYSGEFLGVPSGYAQGQGDAKKSYFYSLDQTVSGITPPAINLQSEPMTGMIMNYAELQFILAEAAAKGWISGSPETYYNNGTKSSITLWLPSWSVDVATYLANADIQWVDTESLDEKMEKIHLQKYYSLFLTDLQQWFEYRRTGHPVLPKGSGLKNNGIMPARLRYPVYVQSTNPANYKLAIASQGPDAISTQVWWQKP
ncbi:SusD/RagB family nutrient-binding outer membrane lipoprotein [Pedobacter sp. BS3]|uniref:SusD/RagB family nutrient-binding outer membrane lipoprotein n=1 Tax=Pedobacter sp. BS3 TaxID=2567937 RepID=UPI0011EDBF7C|nr:SusD/RagB family nutrient-binding outer membrane lipoprotein [Pedobacter sp. BS3]TZF84907.1 SusD/RagB family nutrient-binding outer membrane lipoprotein [Pedobacter sp. BS3]